MKFLYEKKWDISNSDLKQIDESRAQLNKHFAMLGFQSYGDPFPYISLKTIEIISGLTKKLIKQTNKLKGKKLTSFDNLVLEDIVQNIQIANTTYNYLYNSKSKIRIGKFLSQTFGKAAYSEIKNSINPKRFPNRELHEYHELFHDLESRVIDSDFILHNRTNPLFLKLEEKFRKELFKRRGVANKFYSTKGIKIDSKDYHLEFVPFSGGFSFWDGENSLATIDPGKMICYKNKQGEYEFFTGFLDLIAIHEIGHAVHSNLSQKTMPKGLRPQSGEYFQQVSGVVSEGVALFLENLGIKYFKENKKELNLLEEHFDICKLFLKTYLPKKKPQVLHDLLTIQEREEGNNPNFPENLKIDSDKELIRLSEVPKYGIDSYMFDDQSIDETILHLSYFFGEKRIKNLTKKMNNCGIDEPTMIHALLNGFWCSEKAQEKFIFDLYLPEVMK